MSEPRCKCSMAISATGDGCRYCQPQEHIDRLSEWLDDERKEITRLQSEVERLRGRLAWFEEWRERFIASCNGNIDAWLLIKQAEAIEAAVYELTPGRYGPPDDPSPEFNAACEMCAEFSGYAQRLRQQADND